MRVTIASLFVVVGVLAAVALLSVWEIWAAASPVAVGISLGAWMLALCTAALFLFNPRGSDPLGLKTQEEHLRCLEKEGLLVSSDFQAKRAFAVAEFEDEGPHYFVELLDGRVLCLTGQYLYDYEPITDDPEVNQPRRFPCSDFTIRRHKAEGYVVDLVCRGAVLEPEFVAPPFAQRDFTSGRVPEDGQVLADTTYDELRASIAEKQFHPSSGDWI